MLMAKIKGLGKSCSCRTLHFLGLSFGLSAFPSAFSTINKK